MKLRTHVTIHLDLDTIDKLNEIIQGRKDKEDRPVTKSEIVEQAILTLHMITYDLPHVKTVSERRGRKINNENEETGTLTVENNNSKVEEFTQFLIEEFKKYLKDI